MMKNVNPKSYVNIQGWMISELHLSGNSLLVYAIIYGFSQDGESKFTGSLQYLADWCSATKQGVQKNLKELLDKGLIVKEERFVNNQKFCEYSCTPCNSVAHPMQQSCINKLADNKEDTILLSKDNSIPGKDSVESKMYTKSDFLGSRKTNVVKPKNKKSASGASNLFDKCMREIDAYTRNLQIHELLVEYLKLRLAMKDKPIYGVSQWIGILRKLDSVIAEDQSQKEEDIIRQSIERGYASFFPVSKNIKKTDPFSEYGIVNCEQAKPEDISDVEF